MLTEKIRRLKDDFMNSLKKILNKLMILKPYKGGSYMLSSFIFFTCPMKPMKEVHEYFILK